jgi:LacI family transcriptional regulator
MAAVNLKQLAQELNLSISTVSKALRDSYEISADTKKRVLETAKKMGYHPNPYAGFLRHHKSKTIAIIVPELSNNFFIQAISGAQKITQENDYHLLIYITNDDYKKEESILKHLQNGRVDGVIMSLGNSTTNFQHLQDLIDRGVPIIFFDRICHEIETTKITTDDFTSGFNATEHLIQNGCKKILFISLSDHLSIDYKRKQGYFEALNKYNIQPYQGFVLKCDGDEKANYTKIKKALQKPFKYDGIFAAVEKLALTCYYVCNDLGLHIPKQIKVITFSNLRTAPLLLPSLTTITQPAFEMGATATTILFQHLNKKRSLLENENIIIKSELIKRDSTKNNI